MGAKQQAGVRWLAHVDMAGPIPAHDPDLGPCWMWTGPTTEQGYGYFVVDGRKVGVARYVYERAHGPLPDGHEPDHTCHEPTVCKPGPECPHRRCCNLAHLEGVTHRENVLRSGAPTAINAAKEECIWQHPFTDDPVEVNGVFYPGGTIYRPPKRPERRYCLICKNKASAEEKRLKREIARMLLETAGGAGEQLTLG